MPQETCLPPHRQERPAARRSRRRQSGYGASATGSKRFGPYLARWQVLFALAFGALLAVAIALELTAERRTLTRAKRVAESGSPVERRLAVARLEALGEAGVPLLLVLACDETPVPLEVEEGGEYAALVPPDSVCDKALDALRRMREGPDAARAFEWEAASGKSYAQALHEFRRAELDRAREWWKERQAARIKVQPEP